MEPGTIIGIYGALLSTLLGILTWRKEIRTLRVSCMVGMIIGGGMPKKENLMMWTVTNFSKDPIIVTHVGGKYESKEGKKTEFFINWPDLPKKLAYGDYITVYTPGEGINKSELKELNARDSLGKNHKCSKKNLKNVLKNLLPKAKGNK